MVNNRDKQISIDVNEDLIREIKEHNEMIEKIKTTIEKKISERQQDNENYKVILKLLQNYYTYEKDENSSNTKKLNSMIIDEKTLLLMANNNNITYLTQLDKFIEIYDKLNANPVIIGLDFDGVLRLNVKPLLNSKKCIISHSLFGASFRYKLAGT